MSVAVAQCRLKRLVDSGLRGSCRPAERVSQLKKRAKELDHHELRRLELIFSGFGEETRLKILKLIAKEELCGCEVMAALDLTQPTASHHLGILERSGLVTSRREGKWVFYRLADPRVESMLANASGLVERSL